MREYAAIALFDKLRFPAPYERHSAMLVIYGAQEGGFRKADDIDGAPARSVVVGSIGSVTADFGNGHAHDLLLVDPQGVLHRGPFRAPHVPISKSGSFLAAKVRQVEPARRVAESLQAFLDAAMANDLAGVSPFGFSSGIDSSRIGCRGT